MDLNQELLKEIAAMDDEALKKSLGVIAEKMGFDPGLAAVYFSNTEKIRQAVQNLDAKDLDRVRESLGEEKVEEIVRVVRKEMGHL